jgi:Domain of unknown function (DUF1824)
MKVAWGAILTYHRLPETNLSMTIPEADQALRKLQDLGVAASAEQRAAICQCLQVLTKASDYHMIGICAENQTVGLAALQSYAKYFGYDVMADLVAALPVINGSVYLKFNPRSNRLYIDTYQGDYRGGLVSFQSDLADGYNGTHGHFPLDLF